VDLFAHYAVGMFLSKFFNTPWTIFFACILDFDHVLFFIYNKIKKREPIGVPRIKYFVYSKRTWLHSLWGLIILLVLFSYHFSPTLIIVSVGSHLILDALDRSGIGIFPYLTKKKITGPFPVAYSWSEPSKSNIKQQSYISIATTLVFLALFFFF